MQDSTGQQADLDLTFQDSLLLGWAPEAAWYEGPGTCQNGEHQNARRDAGLAILSEIPAE